MVWTAECLGPPLNFRSFRIMLSVKVRRSLDVRGFCRLFFQTCAYVVVEQNETHIDTKIIGICMHVLAGVGIDLYLHRIFART